MHMLRNMIIGFSTMGGWLPLVGCYWKSERRDEVIVAIMADFNFRLAGLAIFASSFYLSTVLTTEVSNMLNVFDSNVMRNNFKAEITLLFLHVIDFAGSIIIIIIRLT